MTDYSETFKNVSFTTYHSCSVQSLQEVIKALEAEISENLAEDHWHPELAGPLQMATHYLQTRREIAPGSVSPK